MSYYAFEGLIPVVHPTAFVHHIANQDGTGMD
ncbi:hypothetical protein ACUOFC_37190, partial [Escherichia sp. TWPC-MK]